MSSFRCTLLSDGSSDRALLPLIDWMLKQHRYPFQPAVWADLRQLRNPPRSLAERIVRGVDLYPCELLFIHRDTEGETASKRKGEIIEAFETARTKIANVPLVICVIPIRMQEAWFLFDELAIRKASGNPNGTIKLDLPPLKKIESLPDPKSILYELLKIASERRGRDLKQFNPAKEVFRVANEIDSFEPLRELPAFQSFEQDLISILNSYFSSQ